MCGWLGVLQAVEIFVRDREAAPREVELIKAMTDTELVAVMPADVKVSQAALGVG
jgi:hypothetical protein